MNLELSIPEVLAGSELSRIAEFLLSEVPGMPPILQTIHLLSICAIMASAVFVSLRILGLAVPSQQVPEMVQRLQTWNWYGVAGTFASGIWFVLARPDRYFGNPVFQIKFAVLLGAIALSLVLYRVVGHHKGAASLVPERHVMVRVLAALNLLLWIAVVLAGRWIAYAEYLFW
jgi:hypothetical protein